MLCKRGCHVHHFESHVFGQFKLMASGKHVVVMDHVPVVGIGGHLLRLLGGLTTLSMSRGVEGCLGLLICLLVYSSPTASWPPA